METSGRSAYFSLSERLEIALEIGISSFHSGGYSILLENLG
jgi:hypothetical protein